MRTIRWSGWLALAALVIMVGGPLSLSAQTASPQQSNDEKKTADVKNAGQTPSEAVVLVAVAEAPPAAAKVPATPAPKPHSGSSSFRWTGFYVGGHIGYGMGSANMTVAPLPSAATFVNLAPTQLHPDPSGMIEGFQGGFNWQRGPVVFGAEVDHSFTGMKGTKIISPIIQNNGTVFPGAGNNLTSSQATDWVGSVRARLGVTPIPRLLLYGTGGAAYGHVTFFANTDFKPVGTENYPAFIEKNKRGWIGGAGVELGLATHFTARFEYLYYDLGNEEFTASPHPPLPPFGIRYNWATSAQIVSGGFNFKF
jgi:outer membrane immunogenic protein